VIQRAVKNCVLHDYMSIASKARKTDFVTVASTTHE